MEIQTQTGTSAFVLAVYVIIDKKRKKLYNTLERRLIFMKKFLSLISSVVGIFAVAAGILLVLDRYFYNNGQKSGYISCDCEPDGE